ncbi:unnamed protein product [Amoebophrya sp. A25]|nr:unnamed protein product [Amoebophrya sp. A25]|eukprot:GSA25T00000190001.1
MFGRQGGDRRRNHSAMEDRPGAGGGNRRGGPLRTRKEREPSRKRTRDGDRRRGDSRGRDNKRRRGSSRRGSPRRKDHGGGRGRRGGGGPGTTYTGGDVGRGGGYNSRMRPGGHGRRDNHRGGGKGGGHRRVGGRWRERSPQRFREGETDLQNRARLHAAPQIHMLPSRSQLDSSRMRGQHQDSGPHSMAGANSIAHPAEHARSADSRAPRPPAETNSTTKTGCAAHNSERDSHEESESKGSGSDRVVHFDYERERFLGEDQAWRVDKYLGEGTFGRVIQCTYEGPRDRMRNSPQRARSRDVAALLGNSSITSFKPLTDDPRDLLHRRQDDAGAGVYTQVGKSYAVKVIRNTKRYTEDALMEADILGKIQKEGAPFSQKGRSRIVSVFDCFFHITRAGERHYCIAFEVLGRSLFEVLKSNEFRGFYMSDLQLMAHDAWNALAFLKTIDLAHTDLKPENILLEFAEMEETPPPPRVRRKPGEKPYLRPRWPRVKMIDMGGATFATQYHSKIISTRQYRSSEVLVGAEWNERTDVFSLGAILMELFLGDLLLTAHDDGRQIAQIEKVIGWWPDTLIERGDPDVVDKFFDRIPIDEDDDDYDEEALVDEIVEKEDDERAMLDDGPEHAGYDPVSAGYTLGENMRQIKRRSASEDRDVPKGSTNLHGEGPPNKMLKRIDRATTSAALVRDEARPHEGGGAKSSSELSSSKDPPSSSAEGGAPSGAHNARRAENFAPPARRATLDDRDEVADESPTIKVNGVDRKDDEQKSTVLDVETTRAPTNTSSTEQLATSSSLKSKERPNSDTTTNVTNSENNPNAPIKGNKSSSRTRTASAGAAGGGAQPLVDKKISHDVELDHPTKSATSRASNINLNPVQLEGDVRELDTAFLVESPNAAASVRSLVMNGSSISCKRKLVQEELMKTKKELSELKEQDRIRNLPSHEKLIPSTTTSGDILNKSSSTPGRDLSCVPQSDSLRDIRDAGLEEDSYLRCEDDEDDPLDGHDDVDENGDPLARRAPRRNDDQTPTHQQQRAGVGVGPRGTRASPRRRSPKPKRYRYVAAEGDARSSVSADDRDDSRTLRELIVLRAETERGAIEIDRKTKEIDDSLYWQSSAIAGLAPASSRRGSNKSILFNSETVRKAIMSMSAFADDRKEEFIGEKEDEEARRLRKECAYEVDCYVEFYRMCKHALTLDDRLRPQAVSFLGMPFVGNLPIHRHR